MMLYLIVYDVSDDDLRNAVRNRLKNEGGVRIQYSAFLLEADRTRINELFTYFRRIIGPRKAKVIAIPICEGDRGRMMTLTHNYELEEEPLI